MEKVHYAVGRSIAGRPPGGGAPSRACLEPDGGAAEKISAQRSIADTNNWQ
jgi:hypothetical protein